MTSNPVETVEGAEVVTSIASKSMMSGATTSMLGWWTSNEAIALIGMIITILGFIVNIIFQIRRDRREQELFLQRAKLLVSKDKDIE